MTKDDPPQGFEGDKVIIEGDKVIIEGDKVIITIGMTESDIARLAADACRRWNAGEITEDEPTYVNFRSWRELRAWLGS